MSDPLHDPMRGRAATAQYPSPYASPNAPPYASSYGTGGREVAGDRLNLRRVLAALRPHLALIALFTLVTVGVTAFLVSREVPTYRARALVQVVDSRNVLPKELGGAVADQASGDQRSDPVLSQIVVLQGRGVLGEAVDKEGLRLVSRQANFPQSRLADVQVTLPADARDVVRLTFGSSDVVAQRGAQTARAAYGAPVVLDGVRFVVPSRPAAPTATLTVLPREDAIDSVGHALRAAPREGTNGVDVEFVSSDSVAAVRVTNGVVDAFQRVDARTAQQDARRRHIFLAGQLVDVEKLLAAAQGQLTAFRQRAQVYDSRDQLVAEQANLLQLDTQREQIEADRRTYQTLLDALTRAPRGDLQALVSAGAGTSNPVIAQLYGQLVQYETARDSLTSGEWGRATTNPDVQRQSALADAARARLIAATRSQLAALGARVGAVDVQRGRRAAVLQTLPSAEAEEQRLGQQVGTLTTTAEQLRSEYQKARIAEAVETGQVNVVSGATRADLVSTHRGARLAFGLALGLLLGIGAAYLIDHFNTSIRNRDELESVLQIPGLAVIPPVDHGTAGRGRGLDVRRLPSMAGFGRAGRADTRNRRPTPIAALAAGTSFDDGDGADDHPRHGVHHASAAAEAYRALRTNLLYAQTGGPLKTLVVTSPAAADGKTTTAVNLSVAFAQQGLRVLLVDCDLRRPALAAALGVPPDPGVTDLLLGRAELPSGIHATRVRGLDVLPCGTARGDAAELLGSPQMRALVDRAAADYDLIVMDTPPVLAASDAVVLAARADGVLLVLRAGETDRGAAQFALQQLTGVRARVVGGVLNDPDAKLARYGGYAAYGYAYAG